MTTRRVLQLAAMIVAVGALAIWLATGANRGWTKTSREVRTMDEIVGIEKITYEKKFTPGVDFLWGAWVGGGILACVSLIFRNKPRLKTETENRTPSPPIV